MVSIQRFDTRTRSTVPPDADIDRQHLRYRVRWREGGRQQTKTFNRMKDAERFAHEKESALRLGPVYSGPLTGEVPTFGEFAGLRIEGDRVVLTGDGWFARYRLTVEQSTYRRRTSAIRHLRFLVDEKLTDVDPLPVEVELADLTEQHRRTAKVVHETIQKVMRAAKNTYSVNPGIFDIAAPVYGRGNVKKKHTYLTADQAKFLADNSGDDLIRCFVRFGFLTGLRPGEALVLTDKDITAEQVWVRGTLEDGKRKDKTKTHSAYRSVPMPSLAKLAVREAQMLREKGTTILFPAPRGGYCFHNHFYVRWHESVERASTAWRKKHNTLSPFEGMTPHDLRHTYASLMIQQGVHAKHLQELMGHSSFKVTMDTYGHLFESDLADAVGRLEAIL